MFQAGPAWRGDGEADQARTIAAVWQARPRRLWRAAPAPDMFDVKAACLRLLDVLGAPAPSLQIGEADRPWLHPGRAGVARLGPKALACFGEIHPGILRALGVDGPVLAFEVYVDDIPAPRAKPTRAKPPLVLNDLMPLTRDFAFVVDEAVPAARLIRAALGAARDEPRARIADVALFDVYRGSGVPAGAKSLAVEVTIEPREKTLTDAEIEALWGYEITQSITKTISNDTTATRHIIYEGYNILLRLLDPIAPHITQVLWRELGFNDLIINVAFPKAATDALISHEIELAVQTNGKLRGQITVNGDADQETIKTTALQHPTIQRHLENQTIKKIIVVPNKLVSIVV